MDYYLLIKCCDSSQNENSMGGWGRPDRYMGGGKKK